MLPTRLLIVDDHILVRKGILMFLSLEQSIQVVGEAESGRDALCQARTLQPDVILMDLVMAEGDGLAAITNLKQELPAIKIIVLTSFDDEGRVKAALREGADGYLLKDASGEILLHAIQAVQSGGVPLHPAIAKYLLKETYQNSRNGEPSLTQREKEVLQLVARGLSNKEIATTLQLSGGTVKTHVSNILTKLNMVSRTEAAAWAIHAGLGAEELSLAQAA